MGLCQYSKETIKVRTLLHEPIPNFFELNLAENQRVVQFEWLPYFEKPLRKTVDHYCQVWIETRL